MPRLPQLGGDDGEWGAILNEFLGQIHSTDGTLKDGVITESKLETALVNKVNSASGGPITMGGDLSGTADNALLVAGSVGTTEIADGAVSEAKLDVAAQAKLNATAPVTSVAGRTGVITIAQSDVSNLTTDLTNKANDSAVIHNTGTETVAGVKTFSSSPVVPTPTLGTQATNKTYVDGVAGAGAPDASPSVKGIVQLTGDLGGTATAPTVARVNGISVSGTPSAGQVLKATSASAASWQADATGGGVSAWNFTSVSSNTTLADGAYALVDTTSSGVTITLPTALSGGAVRIKRMTGGANSVQIVPQAPAEIDGSGVGSHVLGNQWDSMEFVSDGTNWYRG